MCEIILIFIAVVLAARGDFTLFWVFAGMTARVLVGSLTGTAKARPARKERARTRVEIPHYYDPVEYACSVCGARFHDDTMACPHCGVRFNHTETDETAFIEEEEFEDWMDELDERHC